MMGRRAAPINGIGDYDFDKLFKTEGNPRKRIRYLAFAHIQEGKSLTEVAQMVRIEFRTLMNWISNFKKNGIEGLKDKPGRGAKPHLDEKDREAFKAAVLDLQANRKGGRIRGKDVGELMRSRFGIEASKTSVYDTLKRVGLCLDYRSFNTS
jgi:transposase